jgi:hypothetical protein
MPVGKRDAVEDIEAVVLSSDSPHIVYEWHVGDGGVERTWWSDDVWERSRSGSRSFAGVGVDPSISVWTDCVVSNSGKAAVAARRWLQVVHCEEVLVAVGVGTR